MKLWRMIGEGKTYIIAEMSANHGGSLENALKIVRTAKEAGADCLKIQTYTADTLTIDSQKEYFRVRGGLWDGMTLYELYRRAYTPWEWHEAIKRECERLSLDFLSTPFDRSAVDFLDNIGAQAYKIASPELIDLPLIEYAASKGKPMILSCGMASLAEIEDAVSAVRAASVERYALLKCCSEYPAKPQNMNLSVIPDMAKRFCCPVGLSDHTMGSLAVVAAVSLGARVIEKHLCLSRNLPSADAAFSMEPAEFASMVRDVRQTEALMGRPVYGASEGEKRGLPNRRSLFAIRDIEAGETLTEENIRSIRPGQGLPPKYYPDILGKKAACCIERGTPLRFDLIEMKENV